MPLGRGGNDKSFFCSDMAGDNGRHVDCKKRTGFGPHSEGWHLVDFALFDAAPEWLKPKPAQADDCINIDSFQKKRTGFGPHSCDDLVHDYNAVDEINLMRSTFAAF